uniref:Transmembrane protein 238 n=1 Tax=Knipowitschia caucasica TaxID=637954 RepID=A0AAV2KHS8_KNICA
MEANRCTAFFMGLAILLDVLGVLMLLIGIFAPLSYWDFFVFSGPVLMFFSLFLWIFWYLGNLRVTDEELRLHKPDIL